MEDEAREWVWDTFADCLPNLCYINRTRELLSNMIPLSSDIEELVSRLKAEAERTRNPSFKTDIRILLGKLSSRPRNER